MTTTMAPRGRRVRGPGGVWRWVADPTPEPTATEDDGYDGTQPVACDTCGAHADQVCLTVNGMKRQPHPNRRGERVCACGGKVEPRRWKCTNCLVHPYQPLRRSRKGQAAARRAAQESAA